MKCTFLLKSQGLSGEENEKNLPNKFHNEKLWHIEEESSKHFEIVQMFLHGVFPQELNVEEREFFVHKVDLYKIVKETLFKQGLDEKLRRCFEDREIPHMIEALQSGETGGHYIVNTTLKKSRCGLLVAHYAQAHF